MTDIVYDYITTGIDMIVSSVIVAAVVVLLRSATIMTSYTSTQQEVADRLNYYKEYVAYDRTTDSLSPDVVSTMSYYKYDIDIVIQLKTGVIWTNYTGIGMHDHEGKYYCNGTEKTYDDFVDAIGSTKTFSANLYEDFSDNPSTDGYKGGLITGIKFTET